MNDELRILFHIRHVGNAVRTGVYPGSGSADSISCLQPFWLRVIIEARAWLQSAAVGFAAVVVWFNQVV